MPIPLCRFFLASREHDDLAEPRRCLTLGRAPECGRDDALLVTIEPPWLRLPADPFEPLPGGIEELERVLVTARHAGHSALHLREWPVYVYVLRPTGARGAANDALLAWAELYPNEASAHRKQLVRSPPPRVGQGDAWCAEKPQPRRPAGPGHAGPSSAIMQRCARASCRWPPSPSSRSWGSPPSAAWAGG